MSREERHENQFHPTPDSEGLELERTDSYGQLDYANELDELDPIP
jgi:hypothetical protein